MWWIGLQDLLSLLEPVHWAILGRPILPTGLTDQISGVAARAAVAGMCRRPGSARLTPLAVLAHKQK